jgi:hypothetical protein
LLCVSSDNLLYVFIYGLIGIGWQTLWDMIRWILCRIELFSKWKLMRNSLISDDIDLLRGWACTHCTVSFLWFVMFFCKFMLETFIILKKHLGGLTMHWVWVEKRTQSLLDDCCVYSIRMYICCFHIRCPIHTSMLRMKYVFSMFLICGISGLSTLKFELAV